MASTRAFMAWQDIHVRHACPCQIFHSGCQPTVRETSLRLLNLLAKGLVVICLFCIYLLFIYLFIYFLRLVCITE